MKQLGGGKAMLMPGVQRAGRLVRDTRNLSAHTRAKFLARIAQRFLDPHEKAPAPASH